MDNYCKPPKATSSEFRLRNVLRSRKIPFKTDQVIWYTSCDCFTPDLIIGRSLIIEVDGKVHDKDNRKTLDRIRQRALENMGYTVHRVKNEAMQINRIFICDPAGVNGVHKYSVFGEACGRCMCHHVQRGLCHVGVWMTI